VDDLYVIYNSDHLHDLLLAHLRKKYGTVRSTTNLKQFLALKLTEDNDGSMLISQETYINNAAATFNLINARSIDSPTPSGKYLPKPDDDEAIVDQHLYQAGVGTIRYAADNTRPELAFVAGDLGRFMNGPTAKHHRALKQALVYWTTRPSQGLLYKRDVEAGGKLDIQAWTDASWASNAEDRRSIGGYAIYINGNLIHWQSKQQKCTAQSSAESELIAASELARELIGLRNLLTELGFEVASPTIYIDNQATIKIANNQGKSTRVKHIDVKHQFLCERMAEQAFHLVYCPTEFNRADIFTKPLNHHAFPPAEACLLGGHPSQHTITTASVWHNNYQ
jgi:hypothetical protein